MVTAGQAYQGGSTSTSSEELDPPFAEFPDLKRSMSLSPDSCSHRCLPTPSIDSTGPDPRLPLFYQFCRVSYNFFSLRFYRAWGDRIAVLRGSLSARPVRFLGERMHAAGVDPAIVEVEQRACGDGEVNRLVVPSHCAQRSHVFGLHPRRVVVYF